MASQMKPGDGDIFEDGSRSERRRPGHVDRMARPRMPGLTDRPLIVHRAVAEAEVAVSHETLSAIVDGTNPKGDVLGVAELAGVMAGKRASDLIPLLHTAGLTELLVNAVPDRAAGAVRIRSETAAVGAIGVEMEAMTAAAVAALTVYDMIRDLEPAAAIRSIRLVSSTVGEQDAWRRQSEPGSGQKPPRGARIAGRVGGGSGRGPGTRPPARRGTP
jgi:cyclic pyranopterin monophosphate synthase